MSNQAYEQPRTNEQEMPEGGDNQARHQQGQQDPQGQQRQQDDPAEGPRQ